MDVDEFYLDSIVRRHHVYKSVWTPVTGKVLAVEVEHGNHEDQNATAVLKGG